MNSNSEEVLCEDLTVPYSLFFTNKRSLVAIFINFTSGLVLLYFGPVLVPYLVKQCGVAEDIAGYGVAVCWLMYSVACPVAGWMY